MIPRLTRLLLTFSLLVTMLPSQAVLAASSPSFGQEYGLMVHAENEDQIVTRGKALQILRAYFPEAKVKIEEGSAGFTSQRELLLWFEKLRLSSQGKMSRLSDEELYTQTWLRVRRDNLLPQTRMTYGALQEFLYRYSVSQTYGGRPYLEGLVLDESEINSERFSSLYGVQEIKGELFTETLRMKALGVLSKDERDYLTLLSARYESFKNLEDQLKQMKHPFSQIPDMPQDLRQAVLDHELSEVLASISYNYSHDAPNRIHNLLAGAYQMHAQVYQPGDIIDFTKELGRNGWGAYKYGWVIFGGAEAWQFGGGLCGSATITFTPAWKAGLEVVSRYPHSAYYSNLYPEESFGLDATIYRGAKNLIMRNSTNDPLMFYVKNDKEKQEVTMYLIGNSPYYNIEIEGPIEVSRNTYKWIRRMQQFDGKVIVDEMTTRYGVVY